MKIGLSEELIIAEVRQSKHKFDLSVPGLKALKQAGASDRLIAFLMDPTKPVEPKAEPPGPPVSIPPAAGERAKDQPTIPQPNTGAALTSSGTPNLPTEVRVYVRVLECARLNRRCTWSFAFRAIWPRRLVVRLFSGGLMADHAQNVLPNLTALEQGNNMNIRDLQRDVASPRTARNKWSLILILILIGSTSGLHAQPRAPSLANVKQVTPERDYVAPAWSPVSADHIAFAPEGFAGIYLMTLSTKEISLLTDDVASGFQFVWAPDGEHIVYRAKQDPLNSIIGMVNLRTKLKTSLSIAESDIGLPSFKSKRRIAYSVRDRLEEIAVGVTSRETPGQVERFVVFQRDDQIFVAIGGGVSRVSKPPGKYYLPNLSPDGTKVVYEEISRGIYMSNAGGSDEDIYLGQGNNPKWSPDGAYIVYEIPMDNGREIISSSLYVFDVVGRKATRLTNTASTVERRPSFSADGARIAFDANGAIYIADFIR